jgi:hypothetical protein
MFWGYLSARQRQDHMCRCRRRTRTLHVYCPGWRRRACVMARALYDCVIALFPGILELSLVLYLMGWCRYTWRRAGSNWCWCLCAWRLNGCWWCSGCLDRCWGKMKIWGSRIITSRLQVICKENFCKPTKLG